MKTVMETSVKPKMASFVINNDKYFDSTYIQYHPIPSKNSLPSSFMLDLSFKAEKSDSFYAEQIKKIQDKLGVNKVVWGYKRGLDGGPVWELYFYHHKKYPEKSYQNIVDILKPFLSFNPPAKLLDNDYYLISVEITNKKSTNIGIYYAEIPDIRDTDDRYYLADTPYFFSKRSHVSAKVYKLESNNPSLGPGNRYIKIHPENINEGYINEQLQTISGKLFSSSLGRKPLDEIARLPFMSQDNRINLPYCITEKKNAIGLYFLDISYDNLIAFLKYFNYPTVYIAEITKYRSRLDYLQMDMGFDIVIKNGKIAYQKPCITGTF